MGSRLFRRAFVLGLSGIACASSWEPDVASQKRAVFAAGAGVLTAHNDLARTGANLNETALNVSNVKTSFGKLTSLAVSGQIYAQPLYLAAAIGGKNAVFIATEQNKVYAFNADPPYNALWSGGVRTLETPWTPPLSFNCSNTQKPFGINSTPVIDTSTTPPTLYVVTKTGAQTTPKYYLHALDLTTGQDRPQSPIAIGVDANNVPVSLPGTGTGSSGGKVSFDAAKHQNRVALTLSPDGVLSVGFGSYCDQDPYRGWILRFNTKTTPVAALTPFVTTPNSSRGALWMGGAGFPVAETGALYFASGNGPPTSVPASVTSLGNAFVKLTGSSSQPPAVASWFMPSDYANLDSLDRDVGSSGPLLIPGTDRLVGGGKNGTFYVLKRDALGGFQSSPINGQIVQSFSVPNSTSASPRYIVGSPVYWNGPQGPTMYVWPGRGPLVQYPFNSTTGTFTTASLKQASVNPSGDSLGGLLSLSAKGSGAASKDSGIVWATFATASVGGGAAVPGVLYAFNAEDVSVKLWDSNQRAEDKLTSFSKYAPPTVADGKVFVPTFSDKVEVYGLSSGGGGGSGGASGSGGTSGSGGVGGNAGSGTGGTPALLDCNNVVDPGPAQATTWSYIYSEYLGPGTIGHCGNAGCHQSAPLGNFLCGTNADTCYAGLVSSGQVTPSAGASSPIGNPAPGYSALAWFGSRATSGTILEFMPRDQQDQNARAVAAICGWVKAGALGTTLGGLGQACSLGSECTSGSCVDGVCCSGACGTCMACSNAKTGQPSGTCAPILNGGLDSRCTKALPCGNDGACNGAGVCRKAPAATSCGTASCSNGLLTPAPACDGNGTCATASSQSCAPFICGTNACTTTCTSNANCAAGAQCSGGSCVACSGGVCCAAGQTNCSGACVNTATDPANCGACGGVCGSGKLCSNGNCLGAAGQACTSAGQCASGACVDGFCCSSACTGTCMACSNARTGSADGTCAAVKANTTVCRSASCSGGVATAEATCSGSSCPAPVTTSCNQYVCGPTACKTSCSSAADCVAGDYCAGSVCTPKKATGAICAADAECTSSSCSTDGVCCSSTCKLSCQACSSAKTGLASGTCGPTTTPAGTAVCSNACVNTLTDPANCGGCAKPCANGATCSNGVCSAPTCSATNASIDNFEDANNVVSPLEGRNGGLYTYVDTTGSTISPAASGAFVPAAGGNAGSARAAHFSGRLSGASTVWAGFGADFRAPKALYNAGAYTSISFWAKKGSATAGSVVRVKIPDRNTDPVGGVCTACSNDFGADISLTTTWTKFTIPFSSMTQLAGWGAPRPARLDPTGLVAVQFQVTAPGASYDVWVDDVSFGCN